MATTGRMPLLTVRVHQSILTRLKNVSQNGYALSRDHAELSGGTLTMPDTIRLVLLEGLRTVEARISGDIAASIAADLDGGTPPQPSSGRPTPDMSLAEFHELMADDLEFDDRDLDAYPPHLVDEAREWISEQPLPF